MMAVLGILIGFCGLELVSAAIHRWLMHGPLWFIHRSHHRPGPGFFQRNDVFTLIFGGAGVYLLYSGIADFSFSFWVGVGISLYGLAYFLLHDMLVHRRIGHSTVIRSTYLKALVRAHRAHHRWVDKHPGESYGLFLFSRRYWRDKFI
jgi:beta-carotene 3-hydroxylase